MAKAKGFVPSRQVVSLLEKIDSIKNWEPKELAHLAQSAWARMDSANKKVLASIDCEGPRSRSVRWNRDEAKDYEWLHEQVLKRYYALINRRPILAGKATYSGHKILR